MKDVDEELLKPSRATTAYTLELLKYIDVLVDGKFVEELKDITLLFKGSKNQRVIDVQKSLEKGEVVLFDL
jgi:anaerobic ribonucleoside-triphosphate reductase activating protein